MYLYRYVDYALNILIRYTHPGTSYDSAYTASEDVGRLTLQEVELSKMLRSDE